MTETRRREATVMTFDAPSALVVYELPACGLVDAIAFGLRRTGAHVDVRSLDAVDPLDVQRFDVVVVGAGAASFLTARSVGAADAPGLDFDSPRLRDWLAALAPHEDAQRPLGAAFDTRLARLPKWSHTAAVQASRTFARHGYPLAARPASFRVYGAEAAPDKEQRRATDWAGAVGGAFDPDVVRRGRLGRSAQRH